MSKLILFVGQSGSGKSTYVLHCLSKIPKIKYLKTITTRKYRNINEFKNSEEYVFVSLVEYERLRAKSIHWDHDVILGNSYGIDLDCIQRNTNYLLCIYPDKKLLDKIKSEYPLEIMSIFIDVNLETTGFRISIKRPASESERLEIEKNLQLEKFKEICDYIFKPENILEKDVMKMESLVRNIII